MEIIGLLIVLAVAYCFPRFSIYVAGPALLAGAVAYFFKFGEHLFSMDSSLGFLLPLLLWLGLAVLVGLGRLFIEAGSWRLKELEDHAAGSSAPPRSSNLAAAIGVIALLSLPVYTPVILQQLFKSRCNGDTEEAAFIRSLPKERWRKLHDDVVRLRELNGGAVPLGPAASQLPEFADLRAVGIDRNANVTTIYLKQCFNGQGSLSLYIYTPDEPGKSPKIHLTWKDGYEALWP